MPGSLISAEAVHALLSERPPGVAERPTLLDVRWEFGGPPGYGQYLEGHIPGAAFVDLDAELAAPPGAGGRHPLPDAAAFESAMRGAGVSNDRPVIVYDAATSMSAARAWWVLRYYGHTSVSVLDGGFAAWVAAGYPVEAGPVAPVQRDFSARPGGLPLLEASDAAQLALDGVLLDARTAERFRGESEPIDPVAGHIPGARNHPSTENLDAAGHFRDPDTLRAAFERLGVGGDVPVGTYCGSGILAATEVLALELAGYRAALYVGSWSDWITDPGRPVATGP